VADSFSNKQSNWPSPVQWKQLYRVLGPKEKVALPILVLVFVFFLFSFAQGVYFLNALVVPAKGGTLVEGIVGSPRFINPLYADANDTDRDISQLVYSGILSYNSQGEIVPDLAAQMPEITEGGRVVTVSLREDVQWHDGSPFSADDILFTVGAIQDPATRSPIRANWIGIDAEKVSDYKVRFHLLEPYAPFTERLTLKILPVHVWKEISPENLPLTPLNLQPVGTGPYTVKNISQNRSGFVREIRLEANDNYYAEGPFIESVTLRFFENEEALITEANRGSIHSFSLSKIENIERMKNPTFASYAFDLPRYFALFFNLAAPQDQTAFQARAMRQALSLALNRDQLLDTVFGNKAERVDSPFLPDTFGFAKPQIVPEYDPQQALSLLEEQGYRKEHGKIGKAQLSAQALRQDLIQGDSGPEVTKLQQCLAKDPAVYPEGTQNGTFGQLTKQAVIAFQEKYAQEVLAPLGLSEGTGKAGELTRNKLNALCFANSEQTTPLELTIATVDQSPLIQVARELKKQWEEFGLQVEVQALAANTLERDVLKPRAYQTLLFGEVLGAIPDPFPFWHSTQTQTPGLNLSSYENKTLDSLLESTRKESGEQARNGMLEQMQDVLLYDTPALFLYDIDHYYFVTKDVQGIQASLIADPSWRFARIEEWYIQTKRQRQ